MLGKLLHKDTLKSKAFWGSIFLALWNIAAPLAEVPEPVTAKVNLVVGSLTGAALADRQTKAINSSQGK